MSSGANASDEPTGDMPGRGGDASRGFETLDDQARGGGFPAGSERAGDTVGPYRLLEVLGEGGFGVVWLAERREPMVQRVALKVVKPGMDSRAVVARFEQERQALAVMDHPNVARVFDGGVTASGRPYFVMEHVDGEPITAYADRRRLTLRERLELFVPVCEAVQHAHHKGLIHRDLKPSNVLVAEIEGKPVPKVIDFGVAKAVAGEGWANTAHTQSGMVIGTPLYMSPEQVAGETDVDTRADVYSLGVMLYELLAGEVPFDAAVLRKAALAEVQRIIREETPPKPSTRLAQLADARTTTVAEARSASRERLAGELRRELDWIPLMALRKERERRYESPQALADDLRRYLEGRPLRAAPESRAYLARKFVRRNRVQVAAAAAVFVALGAGLVVALWQRNEAILAQEAEKERAEQLQEVSDFQSRMLVQIDAATAGVELMRDVRGRFAAALEKAGVPDAERTTRVDALWQELARVNATDTAAAMIDRTILKPAIVEVDARFKDQPAVDATLRQALARVCFQIGLGEKALPLQTMSLANSRRSRGEEHPDTLAALANMGMILQSQGRFDEAEPYIRQALDTRSRALGLDHPETLQSMNDMGVLLHMQGRPEDAERHLRDAFERSRRVQGEDHPDTLVFLVNLGALLNTRGDLAEAERCFQEVLEKHRRVLGEEHPDTLVSLNNMGFILQQQGKIESAEALLREALERTRRVRGEEHPDTLVAMGNTAMLLEAQQRLGEAEALHREVLEVRRRTLGVAHPDTLLSIANLGALLQVEGRVVEAEALLREALAGRRGVLGDDHPDTLLSLANLGSMLEMQTRVVEAEALFREAAERGRRVLGVEHPDTLLAINSLAMLLESTGRPDEAEPLMRETLELRRQTLGGEHPITLVAIGNLAVMLEAQGKRDEAEELFRAALETGGRVFGERHPLMLAWTGDLGALLRMQGRDAEALDLLVPVEQAAREAFAGTDARGFASMLATLGRARVGLGYDAERFRLAEACLLEAYPMYVEARGAEDAETLGCVEGLERLYSAWHAAEPGGRFDAKAREWKARLEAASMTDP
jgi:eukaryotic-like serine/threonine-protein kinase